MEIKVLQVDLKKRSKSEGQEVTSHARVAEINMSEAGQS